jgi:signal transduction histidine kinase
MFKPKGIRATLDIRGGCDTPEPDCGPLCLVEADFGLISQVPANMFSNALKYAAATRESPEPFMRCTVFPMERWRPKDGKTPARPGLCVEVLTSGEHIKPDETGKLFEKYFRASNTAGISGTGKGLHFVHEIVRQHGGEVGYRPDPRGNVFYFILPCAPPDEA